MSAIARFSVAMTLRAPFMFQGLANARLGADAAYLRAERSDDPVIPADQVKGVLSAACYTLAMNKKNVAPLDLVHRLFSEESLKGTDDAPKRGLLIFSDLRAAEDRDAGTTTRIEIDDETGAVKSGALQVVELAAPFGRETLFSGEIALLARDVEIDAVAALLDRAIKLAPAPRLARRRRFRRRRRGSARRACGVVR
ncbi:MAG: hypothetical protein HYS63_01350 [Methylocystis sp.]|nr:hypothetical protein [Methylocystis sp.]